MKPALSHLPRSITALLEICLLFLPAIPAYIWVWPNITGNGKLLAHILTYGYVILGSFLIGLRRWKPADLGINLNGIRISLLSGMAIVIGRTFVILSVDWGAPPPSFNLSRLLGEGLYYFLLVGFGEEILFRGLLYRTLEDWRGVRWAIWGSSIGFVLWHLVGQGPLVGSAMLLYGLIFALMRWRSGGILGLVLIHGLIDFLTVILMPDINITYLARPDVTHLLGLLIGLALIAFTPLYLWKIHPLVSQSLPNLNH
jgi:membrane protease YdiL (CAAX protease family)